MSMLESEYPEFSDLSNDIIRALIGNLKISEEIEPIKVLKASPEAIRWAKENDIRLSEEEFISLRWSMVTLCGGYDHVELKFEDNKIKVFHGGRSWDSCIGKYSWENGKMVCKFDMAPEWQLATVIDAGGNDLVPLFTSSRGMYEMHSNPKTVGMITLESIFISKSIEKAREELMKEKADDCQNTTCLETINAAPCSDDLPDDLPF